jgi:NAD+ diphosphatase
MKEDEIDFPIQFKQHIGLLNGKPCYTGAIKALPVTIKKTSFSPMRPLYSLLQEDIFWAAFRAKHLLFWDMTSQFCSKCGSQTVIMDTERAKKCTACNFILYPRISPAVIVAIIKDSKILLAHSRRFPAGFYSVIAGFVEPGETLEECVEREIYEEVGIRVKEITYFNSQPWPFPDSLMIAFTAKYSSGKIKINKAENSDAGWYTKDKLPAIPPKASIARKLIDWFVNQT